MLAGCVEQKLTLTSEPPGALVYLNHVEVGRTPLTMPFTWYGDYDVVLRLDGYETLKTHTKVSPPVYELPPFDLFSEMAPWTYHVDRSSHFILTHYKESTDRELIDRSLELRNRTDEGQAR